MIKFSEVAHLYLGCELIGSYRLEPRKGYLTGITNGGEDVEIQFFEEDGINVFESPEHNTVDEIKPILRPLSDMKIEEGAWCLKETYFSHVEYPIKDFYLEFVGEKQNNPRIQINNDWFYNDLTFGNNGSIWSTRDVIPANTKIKATVFSYLLKQGFDLFGLIENGEALDKTKC